MRGSDNGFNVWRYDLYKGEKIMSPLEDIYNRIQELSTFDLKYLRWQIGDMIYNKEKK